MEENKINAPLDSSPQDQPSVMSVGLRYGLILTAISIIYMLVLIAVGSSPFEQDWKGYVNFIFIIAVFVMAHKYFKDNGDSYMSYGQGFGITFMVTLISTIIGMIFSYVYINFIDPGVFEMIWEKAEADMIEKGQNEEAIQMGLEWGRKLFWVFYLVGSLFWGAIIGLIVTIFTQKKRPVAF
jgi:hypothetical protein